MSDIHCHHSVCDTCWAARVAYPKGVMEYIVANAERSHRFGVQEGVVTGDLPDNLRELAIAMVIKQKGRCIITTAPFIFKVGHQQTPAIVTLNEKLGFVDGNMQIIVALLDTPNRPTNEFFAKIRADHFAAKKRQMK